jgi:hypothetical protein
MGKKHILKDNSLQQILEDDGFVKISLFKPEEAGDLLECYSKYAPQHSLRENEFHHTTHYTKDWRLIENVSRDLRHFLATRLDTVFCDYSVLGAAFIMKSAGEKTEFVPHQDWTLMDEEKYYSLNLWIPLHEVTGNNGMLRFLKGSHKLVRNLRMPPDFPNLYGNVMDLVYPQLTTVPLKFGEAVVFDCGTLHGSFPNNSNDFRKSVIVGIYSKDAEFKFYYNTNRENSLIEEYDIKPEEFMTFAVGERPNNRKPDRLFKYTFPVFSGEDFKNRYQLK